MRRKFKYILSGASLVKVVEGFVTYWMLLRGIFRWMKSTGTTEIPVGLLGILADNVSIACDLEETNRNELCGTINDSFTFLDYPLKDEGVSGFTWEDPEDADCLGDQLVRGAPFSSAPKLLSSWLMRERGSADPEGQQLARAYGLSLSIPSVSLMLGIFFSLGRAASHLPCPFFIFAHILGLPLQGLVL